MKLNIGYKEYKIRPMCLEDARDHGGCVGYCDHEDGHIVIDFNWGDLQEVNNTILHEVLHACYHVANVQEGDDEERIVTQLTNVLLPVLQNPEFIKTIRQGMKDEKPTAPKETS